jgi:hypothetical protein
MSEGDLYSVRTRERAPGVGGQRNIGRSGNERARIFGIIALLSLAVAIPTVWPSTSKLYSAPLDPDYQELEHQLRTLKGKEDEFAREQLLLAMAGELRKTAAKQEEAKVVAVVSCIGVVIGVIGTSYSILLGWRAERRQTEEAKLKNQQLERQLAETEAEAKRRDQGNAL